MSVVGGAHPITAKVDYSGGGEPETGTLKLEVTKLHKISTGWV